MLHDDVIKGPVLALLSPTHAHEITKQNCIPVQKLQDLKEYMDNKEMTMARIKELEDLLSNERIVFENKVKEFREQMEQEKQT